jgi:hypothetical protein
MRELFASGRIVDLILGLTLLEAVAIGVHHRWTRRGVGLSLVLANLLAGACLLAALRLALTGAAWPWIALVLAAAFAAHLTDLRQRVRLQIR